MKDCVTKGAVVLKSATNRAVAILVWFFKDKWRCTQNKFKKFKKFSFAVAMFLQHCTSREETVRYWFRQHINATLEQELTNDFWHHPTGEIIVPFELFYAPSSSIARFYCSPAPKSTYWHHVPYQDQFKWLSALQSDLIAELPHVLKDSIWNFEVLLTTQQLENYKHLLQHHNRYCAEINMPAKINVKLTRKCFL